MKTKVKREYDKHVETIIPSTIGNELKLCPGDSLEWSLEERDGIWVAVVSKVD